MVRVITEPSDENQPILPSGTQSPNVPDDQKTVNSSIANKEAITSAMVTDPIHQDNFNVAIRLLETALASRNVPLVKHHVENVTKLVTGDNCMHVLLLIGRWVHSPEENQPLTFEPSAPPLVDNDHDRRDAWIRESLAPLRQKVLLEIDKRGDHFLKHQDLTELHYRDIFDITTSDSLRVSNELIVYCAIMRWARQECKRKELEFDSANIPEVLRDILYAPRYGLMSKKEFSTRTVEEFRGPDRVGLSTEINEKILKYLIQKEKKKKNVEELPYKMSRPRKAAPPKKPPADPVTEKVIINCLTCFSAVFD